MFIWRGKRTIDGKCLKGLAACTDSYVIAQVTSWGNQALAAAGKRHQWDAFGAREAGRKGMEGRKRYCEALRKRREEAAIRREAEALKGRE
jgi:hypothetical protein